MRVIGIGDNVVDQYIQKGIMYPGGNALNFSVYAKRMGADAAYAGVFGNDRAGLHIHHVMNSLGIDIRFSRIENGENGISVIRLNDGDRSIEDVNEGGVLKKYPIILDDELLRHIQNFHWSIPVSMPGWKKSFI